MWYQTKYFIVLDLKFIRFDTRYCLYISNIIVQVLYLIETFYTKIPADSLGWVGMSRQVFSKTTLKLSQEGVSTNFTSCCLGINSTYKVVVLACLGELRVILIPFDYLRRSGKFFLCVVCMKAEESIHFVSTWNLRNTLYLFSVWVG